MKSIMFLICLLINFFITSSSFQTSFFQIINKEYLNKNLLVSPLSAYHLLSLTSNGAANKSLQEMLSALGSTSQEELNNINKNILDVINKMSTLEIANAIMARFRPKQGFMNAAALYKASVEPLMNIEQVNNWCNLKTHGKIPKILEQLPPLTGMVLLNAIYFKGVWKTEFNITKTTKKLFYNLNNNSQKKFVDTMAVTEYFNYYEDREVQIVELPYKDDSMSAIILLPNKDININDFISNLNEEKLQRLIKRMYKSEIELELPKFKLEFGASLIPTLQKMGMIEVFGNADFTRMLDSKGFYIAIVKQKSYLSVDEKGTEAAAVTIVVIKTRSSPGSYPMIIDRPFLFMLRNKNLPEGHDMLFMAKIEEL